MKYNDYLEVMPTDIIKKLNVGYGKQKAEVLSANNNLVVADKLKHLYRLINKSEAYFNSYKSVKIKVCSCNSLNQNHKQTIKQLGCCNDFSIYDGYLVPRYLNMDRCYCDHYNCEMDIFKILLLLLGLKTLINKEVIYNMALERIQIINSVASLK